MNLKYLIGAVGIFLTFSGQAQEQWRFHLAFEDATGATDTIWMLFDTAATVTGVDHELGEGAVELDTTGFHVWIHNWEWQPTNTKARPFIGFPYHDVEIFADNYEFPVILRWDTSLFTAPGLPPPGHVNGAQMDCGHFFFYNNVPFGHVFNMLSADSVSVEMMFEGDWLFPLIVNFGTPLTTDLEDFPVLLDAMLYPNPAKDKLQIVVPGKVISIVIQDASGRKLMDIAGPLADSGIDISHLEGGTYLATIHVDSATYMKRFVKH